ncbi:hypothetical protein AAZX31_03G075600 [Glycine max]|uniref:uncharacterized protein LOC114406325 n=1 Tax=Glycine soja TaxID=3848 RepID=UPI000294F1CB|nr:uncharacterized protein LOC100306536 isoform X1 [Glycine max]XP_014629133.1 uncharacterized protein LOC100306536 isoform X1 [Glycine max]XP_025983615.1 uncharacterized protein LOC100306536 isoform X1 [Glycine max]XP_028224817.1 uncharacterized protein LOC114406325 [Glycine soja]KAG4393448.1 hypothetical protein GLYMA_03G083500v4 [Glycine max]KAG5071602.1 hypothetical protein JHK86_006813 [Glycine max]KAH1069106.1 hypothetical protein GYH30_006618 [Glycine max]|eukprot:XP_006576630.1 uncharacterized protein LOC100306536 isoform X1 [Glycine max]
MAELGFQERSSWRKREKKAKVQDDEDRDADIQEPVELDSARNSFSLALKECQDKRSKFEALLKKAASLDLNNDFGSGSSRRLQTLKKSSISSRRSGTATFPIPGTPNFHIAMYKGWSSEQVPLYAGATQKHVFPFNNGKTLPSKWEDAERWIISPVSADTESVIINAPPRGQVWWVQRRWHQCVPCCFKEGHGDPDDPTG